MGSFNFGGLLNGGADGFKVGMTSGNPLITAASTFAGALQGAFGMGDQNNSNNRAGMAGNPGGAMMGTPTAPEGIAQSIVNLGRQFHDSGVMGLLPGAGGQDGKAQQQINVQAPQPMNGPTEPIISMGGMPEQVEKSSILRKNMLGMRGPRDPFMRA